MYEWYVSGAKVKTSVTLSELLRAISAEIDQANRSTFIEESMAAITDEIVLSPEAFAGEEQDTRRAVCGAQGSARGGEVMLWGDQAPLVA